MLDDATADRIEAMIASGDLGQLEEAARRRRCRRPSGRPRFAAFRDDVNRNRPHQALGQATPASPWQPSPRPFPSRIEAPWYDAEHQLRPTGEIKRCGEPIFVSEALAGEPVGIVELASGDWLVRFCTIERGPIERRAKRCHRFAAKRHRTATPSTMAPAHSVNHGAGWVVS